VASGGESKSILPATGKGFDVEGPSTTRWLRVGWERTANAREATPRRGWDRVAKEQTVRMFMLAKCAAKSKWRLQKKRIDHGGHGELGVHDGNDEGRGL
jgi:hypothetical protein